jgi:FkbH-like protein
MLALETGVAEGPTRVESFGIRDATALHRILARAYLDLYELWRARRAIRCVAVDLDGTLWPGIIGDEDFRFDADLMTVPLMYGRYGGLHQALKILQSRGVLLAVVSKNNPSDIHGKWRIGEVPLGLGVEPEHTRHYLGPEDFVALKIGWEPKSQQLRALASELGIELRQLAFIDDSPVEREEVRQALPEVWVLGDDMNLVRETLLTSTRFQSLGQSDEARQRTQTTRARLQREAAQRAAPDPGAFLRSLQVRCTVRRETDGSRVGRIAELLGRTNQFNTTALRLGAAEVQKRIARSPDADVLTLEVADRFTAYGLVGVAVVEGRELSCFALSCRVIGLEAERVLLRRALELCARRGEPECIVRFVPTERNLPARKLFLTPGCQAVPGGTDYRFDLSQGVLPPYPEHCAVTEV